MADKHSVLMVDSSSANQCLYEGCFKKNLDQSSDYFYAKNGDEGWKTFENNDVDFILIFYQLDDMSGLELLKKIRASKNGRFVPIIITTDVIDDKFEIECRAQGAYEYLHLGSFTVMELSKVIHHACEQEVENQKISEQEEMILTAAQFKANFLAVMNHEMQGPLNGMLGMANLLKQTELNDEQKEWVDVFIGASEHILGIIVKIFEINKIESGLYEVSKGEFDLMEHLEELTDKFTKEAKKKGLDFIFTKDEDIPLFLKGGVKELRQVIHYLVDNAIKFTEEGSVEMKVSCNPLSMDPGGLMFSISDTGIGINEMEHDLIFESYTQVDEAITRKFGGVGLGLKMASEIVKRLDGSVWFKTEMNKGSTFFFSVQMEEIEAEKYAHRKRTVLIVDDEDDAREVLKVMLEEHYNVVEAKNAKIALDKLAQCPLVDLVIADMNMPGMDGMKMVQKMKDINSSIPFILLTGYKNREMSEIANSFGVIDVLEKPLKEEDLLEITKSIMSRAEVNDPDNLEQKKAV